MGPGVLLAREEREVEERMVIAIVLPQVDVIKDGHVLVTVISCQFDFNFAAPWQQIGVGKSSPPSLCSTRWLVHPARGG